MAGAQSHEELIVWQLAYDLKLQVYALIETGPITRDAKLLDQLRSAASASPRLIAEGFGRYLPGDFARYLRTATPPNEEPRRRRRRGHHGAPAGEPTEPDY